MKSFPCLFALVGILEAQSYSEMSASSSSYEFDYNYEYINETMYDAYLNWLYSTNYTSYGAEIQESQFSGGVDATYEYAYQYGEDLKALATDYSPKTKSQLRENTDYSYEEYNFHQYNYDTDTETSSQSPTTISAPQFTLDVIKHDSLKTLTTPKTTKPSTRKTTQSTKVKTTRRTTRAPYFDESDTKYPKCFICSASGHSANSTIENCSTTGRWATCKFGEYCGLEVREKSPGRNKFNRFLPKEIHQLNVRCMTRTTCKAQVGSNFASSVLSLQQCGTHPQHKTCFACLRPCSSIKSENCFVPSRGIPTSTTGFYRSLSSLTYQNWKSNLRNLTRED